MRLRVDPHCRAFQNAIELLARPWTGLILSLLQSGPLRFSELEERTQGVGAKTLSARLKELEARRIVARDVQAGPPVRVLYSLTSKGRAFEAVAVGLEELAAVRGEERNVARYLSLDAQIPIPEPTQLRA